jgi:hypothetical protein
MRARPSSPGTSSICVSATTRAEYTPARIGEPLIVVPSPTVRHPPDRSSSKWYRLISRFKRNRHGAAYPGRIIM